MSDIIQFRMEGTHKELFTYQKHNIFTRAELDKINVQRQSYEYKIHRSEKILLDYLHYIAFERNLEKIVKKRTKSKKYSFIKTRILHLFIAAIKRFDDHKLLKMFVEYGVRRKEYEFLRVFFELHVLRNVSNVDLFIYAADVCIVFEDFESGRSFILKGLRFNVNDKRLYIELFRLEMGFVKKSRMINELAGIDNSADVDMGVVAVEVCKEFCEVFGICEEINIFLDMTSEYEEIQTHIKDIINKIKC